jgi:hypothetical protein
VSVETAFRAALLADAGLTALVGTRVAENAVPQGTALPYVVFSARHEPQHGLDSDVQAEQCSIEVQCWGATAASAHAVADAVTAAVDAFDAASTQAAAAVVSRASGYDADLALDADVLMVDWWTP